MDNPIFLSIVIPCYNEAERIGKTLSTIDAYLKTQSYQAEVVVVDNGSTDDTVKEVNKWNGKIANLRIVTEKSHGKGWAVKQGMLAAVGEYRLFTDADNSTDISQIDRLLTFAKAGFDVVISSRKIEGAVITHPQPGFRVFLGNRFQDLVGLIVPLGIKDTQNGFKLFSRKAAEKIFPHQSIYYWAFDVELLGLAKKFSFKIKEVPITWVNDDRSKMNLGGMSRMLFEVILIRLHLATREYY